jgi:hypothetical protein
MRYFRSNESSYLLVTGVCSLLGLYCTFWHLFCSSTVKKFAMTFSPFKYMQGCLHEDDHYDWNHSVSLWHILYSRWDILKETRALTLLWNSMSSSDGRPVWGRLSRGTSPRQYWCRSLLVNAFFFLQDLVGMLRGERAELRIYMQYFFLSSSQSD